MREEDGQLLAVSEEAQETADGLDLENDPNQGNERSRQFAPAATAAPGPAAQSGSMPNTLSVNIQIQVQCTIDELDTLAPKLRTMMKQLQEEIGEDSGHVGVDSIETVIE